MPRIVAQDSTRFWVELPLNTPGGSVRVKRRRCETDFGMIVPACSTRLERADYLEWQIGCDLPDSPENRKRSTLGGCSFSNNVNVRRFRRSFRNCFSGQTGLVSFQKKRSGKHFSRWLISTIRPSSTRSPYAGFPPRLKREMAFPLSEKTCCTRCSFTTPDVFRWKSRSRSSSEVPAFSQCFTFAYRSRISSLHIRVLSAKRRRVPKKRANGLSTVEQVAILRLRSVFSACFPPDTVTTFLQFSELSFRP